MACSDIHAWFLRRHIPVLNVASASWAEARQAAAISAGVTQAVCLRRLTERGMLRRVRRGTYVVIDPAREAPAVAIASGAFSHLEHYVTTDAALAVHGLIDQPIPVITVVVTHERLMAFELGQTTVRPVEIADRVFRASDHYPTTLDTYPVVLASRTQAVVDALAEPHWITHASLLPEVLSVFDEVELERLAEAALARSQAAAQRLGYLLEDARQPIPERLSGLRPARAIDLRPGRRSGVYSTRWRIHG